jgi:ribosomal-protein-alanine N-acetyltransferase
MSGNLITPRLVLRPIGLEDAGAIQRIFPRWEVVRYLAGKVPWPYPDDGALTYLRDIALPAVARGEEWHWTLRLKTDPAQIIGMISLMNTENHNRGFWLGEQWQGQGLMSEAVEAVTDYWFNVLGFPVLRAPKAIVNEKSRGISRKFGMRVIATEERDYVAGRLPSELWEITAEEWRHRNKRVRQ